MATLNSNRPVTREEKYIICRRDWRRKGNTTNNFLAAIIQSKIIVSQNAEINCWINQLPFKQRKEQAKNADEWSGRAQKVIFPFRLYQVRDQKRKSLRMCHSFGSNRREILLFFSFYRRSIYDMNFSVILFHKQSYSHTHTHSTAYTFAISNGLNCLKFSSISAALLVIMFWCSLVLRIQSCLCCASLFYSAGCEVIKSKYLSYVCFFDIFLLLPSRSLFEWNRNKIQKFSAAGDRKSLRHRSTEAETWQ